VKNLLKTYWKNLLAWSFVLVGQSPLSRGNETVRKNFSLLYAIDSEKYLGYAICQTFCLGL